MYGALTDACHFRDVGDRQVVIVAQDDDFTLQISQPPDGAPQGGVFLDLLNHGLGVPGLIMQVEYILQSRAPGVRENGACASAPGRG